MKLKNERYEVCFVEKGGEILSFTDMQSGLQYMWQGDEAYWTGKNPTLFPIVGNTYSKTYTIDGKEYAMKNHGLIRQMNLKCIYQDEQKLVMSLDSDEETLSKYPFPFHYEIAYTLAGDTLHIDYRITNTGDRVMPFIFGLHPGFRCPLCEGERFIDYTLKFSKQENVEQVIFDPSGKVPYYMEKRSFDTWQCSYEEISKYATIIYKGIKSDEVTLSGPKGHGVRLNIKDFPYFAIWTAKTDAPFICLEPWYGHGDFSPLDVDFYEREDTQLLQPQETFSTSYSIQVF